MFGGIKIGRNKKISYKEQMKNNTLSLYWKENEKRIDEKTKKEEEVTAVIDKKPMTPRRLRKIIIERIDTNGKM